MIGAWVIGLGALVGVGFGFFLPRVEGGRYAFRPAIARPVVNDMAHFAFSNYISAVLWSAPTLLLPILITNLSGPEANAYYYVASSVGGLLVMVPAAISMSLFAHGSHDATGLVRRGIDGAKLSRGTLKGCVNGGGGVPSS